MGLKIISGYLEPRKGFRNGGRVGLDLLSARLEDAEAARFLDRAVVGSGAYIRRPCVTAALRRVRVCVTDVKAPDTTDLNVDDELLPSNSAPRSLVVEWHTRHRLGGAVVPVLGGEIREISVLVIGETADPAVAAPGRIRPERPGGERAPSQVSGRRTRGERKR